MFEEYAEEYANKNVPTGAFGYRSLDDVHYDVKQAYRAGAEFGYNKCKEELNQKGLALQSDMDKTIEQNIALKKELNKVKEWHFVSKEGFPNKDDIYLIIRSDGLHLGDYCCGGDGDIDCQSWCDYPSEEEIQDDSVIAWKEITLPKEIKEK